MNETRKPYEKPSIRKLTLEPGSELEKAVLQAIREEQEAAAQEKEA